jgi:hypothetical protein
MFLASQKNLKKNELNTFRFALWIDYVQKINFITIASASKKAIKITESELKISSKVLGMQNRKFIRRSNLNEISLTQTIKKN